MLLKLVSMKLELYKITEYLFEIIPTIKDRINLFLFIFETEVQQMLEFSVVVKNLVIKKKI